MGSYQNTVTLSFMDSRLRGNDIKKRGNDIKKRGNGVRRRGNDRGCGKLSKFVRSPTESLPAKLKDYLPTPEEIAKLKEEQDRRIYDNII